MKIKELIKNFLRMVGVLHPSGGVKIPPERKAAIIVGQAFSAPRILVETGTEFGTTIGLVRHAFDRIYSVELDERKYADAVKKFSEDPAVSVLWGDSATVTPQILKEIHKPALFWLDAHAPGEINLINSPVLKELEAILSHPIRHRILIDDARHFTRSAIRGVRRMAKQGGYDFQIKEGLFWLR